MTRLNRSRSKTRPSSNGCTRHSPAFHQDRPIGACMLELRAELRAELKAEHQLDLKVELKRDGSRVHKWVRRPLHHLAREEMGVVAVVAAVVMVVVATTASSTPRPASSVDHRVVSVSRRLGPRTRAHPFRTMPRRLHLDRLRIRTRA